MANVNTFAGIYNFTQGITTSTETSLLVPAAAGTYPGLPSPVFAAGVGLYITPTPDIAGSELDGHPFRVRISGVVTNGASNSFNLNFYLGTNSTTASNTVIATFTQVVAATGSYPFWAELTCIWDAVKQTVYPVKEAMLGSVYTALTTTAVTSTTVTSIAGLNFIPSFTFSTANASNSVLVREFTLERV